VTTDDPGLKPRQELILRTVVEEHIASGFVDTADERVLEPGARLAWIASKEQERTVPGVDSEHGHGCPAQRASELCGELGAGDTPDAVGPEETAHGQVMLPAAAGPAGAAGPRGPAASHPQQQPGGQQSGGQHGSMRRSISGSPPVPDPGPGAGAESYRWRSIYCLTYR